MKYLNIIITVVLIGIIAVTLFLLYFDKKLGNEVVAGTYFETEDISGMTSSEVEKVISEKVKVLNGNAVTLRMSKQEKTFTWNQLGIEYKEKDLLKKIFEDQNTSAFNKVKLYVERKSTPKKYTVEQFFKEDTFNTTFDKAFPDMVKKPVNATLKVEGKDIIIEGGDKGSVVSKDRLKQNILDANLSGEKVVNVPLEEVDPEITIQDVKDMGITTIIGSYKTNFDPNSKGKSTNIGIAAKKVTGIMLEPNEVFDFFGETGRVTADKGYVEAPVYAGGQSVLDIGGGICQVSSTLYNAALYAGFEIVERHQHGLPVSYVPAGRDATLWFGSKNLRFKNTTGKHAYIQTVVGNGTLEVNIFGTKKVGDVTIESEILERINPPVREIKDPSLAEGEVRVQKSGVQGYKSITHITVKEDGKAKREVLSKDTYRPMERVIRVGTKKVEKPVETQVVEEVEVVQ